MAKKDVVYVPILEVLDQLGPVDQGFPIRLAKLKQAEEGAAKSINLAKKYGLLIGMGTDLLLSPEAGNPTCMKRYYVKRISVLLR